MKNLARKDTEPKFDGKKLVGFTIKREKWGTHQLLGRSDDTEVGCCLGHYGLACGFPKSTMNGSGILSQAVAVGENVKGTGWLLKGCGGGRDVEDLLITANDATRGRYASPKAKEKRIKELFARNGIEVTFR
jgi:hypothetical protein